MGLTMADHRDHMNRADRLLVRVNADLVLDGGMIEDVQGPGDGQPKIIHPPTTTLFHQVLAYLQAQPDPVARLPGNVAGREGVAAAAVTLRWGSYLAALLDHDKPVWSEAGTVGTSRISDGEMARINIEASAALAEWIDLSRADHDAYLHLVDRAVAYLPMQRRTATPRRTALDGLSFPETASILAGAIREDRLATVRADAELHPSRMIANALVNVAWRNGPVEDVHAGRFQGYPLDVRRVTPEEERELMWSACNGMASGMATCRRLATEGQIRGWPEQVLPFGLAGMMLVTPSGWTLTETSREVRLRPLATLPSET